MITDLEVEDFLAHHGVKGQKWGVRTAKTIGRGSLITAKAIGRGTKKTAIFVRDHPRFSASVAAGATFAAILLKRKINKKQAIKARFLNKQIKAKVFNEGMKISSDRVKQNGRAGLEWIHNRPFRLKDTQQFQTQQTRLNWQKLL